MTRTTTTLAVAADYADALLVARRGKNWLFLLLMLVVLGQIAIFCTVRYVPQIRLTASATVASPTAVEPTTQSTQVQVLGQSDRRLTSPLLQYAVAVTLYLGVILPIILAVMLLLIVTVMLVGRLVGVTHVAGAFVWCVVLTLLLFPWQALLSAPDTSPLPSLSTTVSGMTLTSAPDPRVPGILYTWPELVRDYQFSNNPWQAAALKWARFVGFPIIALLLLLTIQARSSRGLRFALGESEVQIDLTTPVVP